MNRRPCAGPWKTPAIDSVGNLTVCCHDKHLSYKLGNLKGQEFDEIWYGLKADELRLRHVMGEFSKLGDPKAPYINCANCPGFSSPKISDAEVISYLKQIDRQELVDNYLDRVCTGWNKIESLLIEVTSKCNLKCVMCKRTLNPQKEGYMSPEMWEQIMLDLLNSKLRVKAITPFWYGEPLLHPKLLDMLKFAFKLNFNPEYDKRFNKIQSTKDKTLFRDFLETYPFNNRIFEYMELHTNGILMTKEMREYLFSEEAARSLGYLVFSLDALTKPTYDKIRCGGDFDRVVENLKECLKLKAELIKNPLNKMRKTVRPVIVIQFIVMPENAHEAEGFVDYWKRELETLNLPFQINAGYEPPFLKDTIFLRVMGDLEPSQQPDSWRLHEKIIRASKHFNTPAESPAKEQKEYIRRPCAGLWKTPVIRWDGEVGVCCYDYNMNLSFGNVSELKLSWLWNLDTMVNRRLNHIRGDFAGMQTCAGCPNLDSPQMTDSEIVEYLQNTGQMHEIAPFLRRMKNYKMLRDFV